MGRSSGPDGACIINLSLFMPLARLFYRSSVKRQCIVTLLVLHLHIAMVTSSDI
jgi:hypothetical protein